MTYPEFRALVARMRAAQKRYFRDRDNLQEAKTLELEVDQAIRLEDEPSLFRDRHDDEDHLP